MLSLSRSSAGAAAGRDAGGARVVDVAVGGLRPCAADSLLSRVVVVVAGGRKPPVVALGECGAAPAGSRGGLATLVEIESDFSFGLSSSRATLVVVRVCGLVTSLADERGCGCVCV